MKKAHELYRNYINPDYIKLIEAFETDRLFVRSKGNYVYDSDKKKYLDCLSGFGVHNVGHNHPSIVGALKEELDRYSPTFLNIDAPKGAAKLAKTITENTHPELCRSIFANSGAEAVEVAIKTAKAATGRQMIISFTNAYHGLTSGAISLMNDNYNDPFGRNTKSTAQIPFGNLIALENKLKEAKPAAFIVEPIQGEGGINILSDEFFMKASLLCKKHKALLIVDEIQTGMGRTGKMFATPFDIVVPDILVIGKALSGGLIPITTAITTKKIFQKAFSGPFKCNLNSSTFAEGSLATVAGQKTFEILSEENLCEKAKSNGDYALEKLLQLKNKHKIVKEVRGKGLLIGIEFHKPDSLAFKVVPNWIRASLFSYVIMAILLRDYYIISQPCSIAENVLRFEPPLNISKDEIDYFVSSLNQALDKYPTCNSTLISAIKKTVFKLDL
ncbi:aspartate aminotransferase family protein [Bacteroidota bacterium]